MPNKSIKQSSVVSDNTDQVSEAGIVTEERARKGMNIQSPALFPRAFDADWIDCEWHGILVVGY
jgi:hypothetical protein